MNVMGHVEQETARLAQDKAMEPFVRQVADALKNAGNMVKAYMQRLQEAAMAQGEQQGMDPKVQAMLIQAESRARISEAAAAQKREHKDAAFIADQNRRNAAVIGEAQRAGARVDAEIAAQDLRTAADMARTPAQ
jgi:hypothetical protein